MKKAINIRLDENLLRELDGYGRELERTRTYLIEKAINSYFDVLDEIVADNRIDEVKRGSMEVMSLKEVAEKLDLTDV